MNLVDVAVKCHAHLLGNVEVLKHLNSRGCDEQIVRELEFGYYLRDGTLPDTYHTRIIAPIRNLHGELVAVAGRVTNEKETPKWRNTSYSKSLHLYGLYLSYPYIRKADCAFVVEGYFDFAVLWAKGIKNVVAMMGASLGVEQGWLLNRFCNKAIVIRDGNDDPTESSFPGTLSQIKMPPDYDPDTFVLEKGADKLTEWIRGYNEDIFRLKEKIWTQRQ